MSQQGPILVVSTARRPSFAATLDIGRLFPVVETEWADAARAVEQVQPAAVLAATAEADAAGLARLAARVAARQPYLPLISVDPETPLPDNVIPFFQTRRQLRSSGGAPARRAARALAACDRDAPAGAVNADGAVADRSGARRHRAADRPRRRLSGAVGRARRAHRRGRRALDRGRSQTSQRPGHRRHRARRRFQPARGRRLPHRADGRRPLPQPAHHRDVRRSGAGLRSAEPRNRHRRPPPKWWRPRCR